MIKPFFFILSPALLTGLAHAQAKTSPYPPEVPRPTYSEVSYGKHERNVLDFWKAASKAPAPVAFVIHGGGWKGGSKERLPRFADPNALLKAGTYAHWYVGKRVPARVSEDEGLLSH